MPRKDATEDQHPEPRLAQQTADQAQREQERERHDQAHEQQGASKLIPEPEAERGEDPDEQHALAQGHEHQPEGHAQHEPLDGHV